MDKEFTRSIYTNTWLKAFKNRDFSYTKDINHFKQLTNEETHQLRDDSQVSLSQTNESHLYGLWGSFHEDWLLEIFLKQFIIPDNYRRSRYFNNEKIGKIFVVKCDAFDELNERLFEIKTCSFSNLTRTYYVPSLEYCKQVVYYSMFLKVTKSYLVEFYIDAFIVYIFDIMKQDQESIMNAATTEEFYLLLDSLAKKYRFAASRYEISLFSDNTHINSKDKIIKKLIRYTPQTLKEIKELWYQLKCINTDK